jgi:hypothetical protein
MNERIKQLEKQCWRSTQSDPYAFFDVKKFAELIVRECAVQCNHNDDMDRILEHFGVEQ